MIQVYSPGNEDFTKNGDCTLFPASAGVNAVLGGAWTATLIHPLDSEGRWRYLVEEAVVKMPSFNGDQLFRIQKPQKSDSGVECTMVPIFYDARHVFLTDVRPTSLNGQDALNYICGNSGFSGVSDILFQGTAYYEYKNLLEAICGDDENSFVNRWGGEPVFDNHTVTINTRAGSDYNVEIRYGKNIPQNGMYIETDMSAIATRIYPKAYNGYEMSNHGYVDSPLVNRYALIYPRTITYDTVKMREDTSEDDLLDPAITVCDTQAQLNTALRAKCNAEFDNGIDKPLITISCDMILLQNTEQYADIAELETVSLGDTVHCYNNHLDFTTSARVMELTYDSIKKRVDNVTLGAYRQSFLDILNKRVSSIDDLAARANSALNGDGTVMAERVRGFLNGAVTSLHAQYNVAEHQDYVAILFENLDTTSDLFGALAIGTQGWMISKRRNAAGTDWVWTTAATAEGIVADTIVTGAISDAAGNNYWDMETGEFRLASTATVGGKTVSAIASDAVDAQTQQSIFNKLTNNGQTQGIYLNSGKLYINASYIATGILADANNNTTFNLSTGALTMKKGSIDIGNGTFKVTTAGALTATSANIEGEFKAGSTYWIKLNSSGELAGGSGNSQYGFIDYSASCVDVDSGQTYRGIQIQGGCLRISTRIITVARSTSTSTTTTEGGNGTLKYISKIENNGDGTITWYNSTVQFINGIMVSQL